MSKIVVQAIPFCYGPATVAIRLVYALTSRGHSVRLLASGTVAELARLSKLEFFACSPTIIAECSEWADVFCCVCDPEMYAEWPAGTCRMVYFDFLYFMPFPASPPPEASADLYLAENYPGVSQAVSTRAWRPSNLRIIPPLIDQPSRLVAKANPLRSRCRVLLTFGGTESPLTQVGINTNYPLLMLRDVQTAIAKVLPSAELQIATSVAACAAIKKVTGDSVLCEPLGHSAFLNAVEQSDVVITHPGLYSVFEAVWRNRPLVLLPPSNYTQVIQLGHYLNLGLIPVGIQWHDILGENAGFIPTDLPEALGVQRVLETIATFAKNTKAQSVLVAALEAQLDCIRQSPNAMVRRQTKALETFCGDGLPEAVAAIEELTV